MWQPRASKARAPHTGERPRVAGKTRAIFRYKTPLDRLAQRSMCVGARALRETVTCVY